MAELLISRPRPPRLFSCLLQILFTEPPFCTPLPEPLVMFTMVNLYFSPLPDPLIPVPWLLSGATGRLVFMRRVTKSRRIDCCGEIRN